MDGMSAWEAIVRVLAQMEPLVPYMLYAVAATIIVLPFLLLSARGLWIDRPAFRRIGMFLGLRGWDCVRLAGAWVKLLLLLAYLASFRRLDIAQYLLFLIAGTAFVISASDHARIPGRVLWLALEFIALLSCGMLGGYIHDVNGAAIYRAAYWMMAIFTALFGVYLFLTELNDISTGRRTELGCEWEKTTEE